MAFVATHECTRCGASQDRRDRDNIQEIRGVANGDCVIDSGHQNGHNFQSVQGMCSSQLSFHSTPTPTPYAPRR